MMKKDFVTPELELIIELEEDIVTASGHREGEVGGSIDGLGGFIEVW